MVNIDSHWLQIVAERFRLTQMDTDGSTCSQICKTINKQAFKDLVQNLHAISSCDQSLPGSWINHVSEVPACPNQAEMDTQMGPRSTNSIQWVVLGHAAGNTSKAKQSTVGQDATKRSRWRGGTGGSTRGPYKTTYLTTSKP